MEFLMYDSSTHFENHVFLTLSEYMEYCLISAIGEKTTPSHLLETEVPETTTPFITPETTPLLTFPHKLQETTTPFITPETKPLATFPETTPLYRLQETTTPLYTPPGTTTSFIPTTTQVDSDVCLDVPDFCPPEMICTYMFDGPTCLRKSYFSQWQSHDLLLLLLKGTNENLEFKFCLQLFQPIGQMYFSRCKWYISNVCSFTGHDIAK